MTVSHYADPLPVPSLVAALGTMRARGLRVSAARRLVLEALFASESPLTAEDIAGGLTGRLPASDLASVYRNLETLEALGLVHHVHVGHGPGRYALAGRHDDAHVVCESCGDQGSLRGEAWARVAQVIREATGFEARFTHFPAGGLCRACAEAQDAS
jgi:Fur family ferric uptake transcriptional regulator